MQWFCGQQTYDHTKGSTMILRGCLSRHMISLVCIFLGMTTGCFGGETANPVNGILQIPTKIGISVPMFSHDRTKAGTAVVSPASEAGNCTVHSSDPSRVTVSNVAVGSGGTITFRLSGIKESVQENDVTITLRHSSSGDLDAKRMTVVIPKSVGTPHDQPRGSATVKRNFLGNKDSSPAMHQVPSDKFIRMTFVGQIVKVLVWDQFGHPCGDTYGGAFVFEGNAAINQSLSADSTYNDPVGPIFSCPPDNPDPAMQNTWHPMQIGGAPNPLINQWVNGAIPSLPSGMYGTGQDADTGVEIDATWELDPAVDGRKVDVIAPDTVNVTWP